MTAALGGSCCSSWASTRNSRERCAVVPSDSLSPIARDVLTPHDVLVLIPSVIDSESLVPCDSLTSRLPDPVRGANGAAPLVVWPRPRLRPDVSLRDTEAAQESAVPTVEE